MNAKFTLSGELCSLGNLAAEDLPNQIVGQPSVQIRLESGRVITLTGLTKDECIGMAAMFGDAVLLSIGAKK